MGKIVLPGGEEVSAHQLPNTSVINIEQLVGYLNIPDLTEHFTVGIICVIGQLGKYAMKAENRLYELTLGKSRMIKEAADQALVKLRAVKNVAGTAPSSLPVVVAPATSPPPPVAPATSPPPPVTPVHTERYDDDDYAYYGSNWSAHNQKRPEIHIVKFHELDGEFGDVRAYKQCTFCEKVCLVSESVRKSNEKITAGKFFCTSCLRNGFYRRSTCRDIMIFSLRGLIGYYHQCYILVPKNNSMYLHDLKEMIETHAIVGSQLPFLHYDPETFCWFVDFKMLGDGDRQLPLQTLHRTIAGMIACFNVYENVRGVNGKLFYDKFVEGVAQFAKNRKRKWGMRVFAPTLFECLIPKHGPIQLSAKVLRSYTAGDLTDTVKNGRRSW